MGKLAVVTGASSGIGAETAVALGMAGWQVVLMARGQEGLEAVARRITEAKGLARVEPCDVSDTAAVARAGETITRALGTPDLVVNSAGAGRWLYAHETPAAEAQQMLGAPYQAAWNTTAAFLPGMLARDSGHLIHIGSPASRLSPPGATAYTVARWALRGFNEALNADLHGTGVKSSHVVFGKVSSTYFEHNPGAEARVPLATRLVRTLTPAECAQHVLDVVADPSREPVFPMMMRFFYWCDALFPFLPRALIQVGRTHHPR